MSSTRAAYERAIQLHNAGDLDGLANLYTENAVLVTPDGTFNGRAAILEGYRMAARPFPDRTVTLDVIIDQGDAIAGEWTWAGTNTGPLVLPDGTDLPATGKRVELKGMDLAQMRDGKVAVQHMYYDNMARNRQLGLLPGEAAT